MLDKIKEALNEGLQKNKEDIDKSIEEKVNPLNEKVSDIEKRIEKVEEIATKKVNLNTTTQKNYKGYNLEKQGVALANKASKDKTLTTLNSGEKMQDLKKFVIDFVRAKVHNDYSKQEGVESFRKAAMNETTDAQGAYLVPEEYYRELLKVGRDDSFALSQCTVVPMKRDIMKVPVENALVSVAWTPEATAATQSEPTISEVELRAKKLDGYSIVSNELLEDADYDIVSILTEQFAYAIQQELDNQVLNGTGDPTSGVLTAKAGYSVITAGDAFSTITVDDFSEAIYKIGKKYRQNARFIIGQIGLHYARTLKDSNNNPIWARPAAAQPGTIYGNPYFESAKITDTTAASTGFSVFGDFKKVLIGRRKGAMQLDVDPYGKFLENQTRFRIVTRWDVVVAIVAAFCRIMTSA